MGFHRMILVVAHHDTLRLIVREELSDILPSSFSPLLATIGASISADSFVADVIDELRVVGSWSFGSRIVALSWWSLAVGPPFSLPLRCALVP